MGTREQWDKRAETFGAFEAGAESKDSYASFFMSKLALECGQTVFDMACGTGALAVPLADAGHVVCARDISPRMIEKLQTAARAKSVEVDAGVMAWEDDWGAHGIGENSFDVAIASRSLPVKHGKAREMLEKLDRVARIKAAVTVAAAVPPAFDPQLMRFLGREVPNVRNHVEVIEALVNMKRFPSMSYIPFTKCMRFPDRETAFDALKAQVGNRPLDGREEELFEQYAAQHLVESRDEDGVVVYQLDYHVDAPWAYIEWKTTPESL